MFAAMLPLEVFALGRAVPFQSVRTVLEAFPALVFFAQLVKEAAIASIPEEIRTIVIAAPIIIVIDDRARPNFNHRRGRWLGRMDMNGTAANRSDCGWEQSQHQTFASEFHDRLLF